MPSYSVVSISVSLWHAQISTGISYDLNRQCVFNLSAFIFDLNYNTAFTEQGLYNYEKSIPCCFWHRMKLWMLASMSLPRSKNGSIHVVHLCAARRADFDWPRFKDSRFKKRYCPFKNILKTEMFLQSHIKCQ